jgi:hypothetical protein
MPLAYEIQLGDPRGKGLAVEAVVGAAPLSALLIGVCCNHAIMPGSLNERAVRRGPDPVE